MSAADGRTWLRYFVHGVDREDVDEQLEELGESHWTYIDGHADALVARGPTLSTDGTSHTGSADRKLLRTLARTDAFVFGGLLISDDGTQSVGLAAAVDADIGRAAALVAALGLPGSTTSVTKLRWRRGGRQTPREHPRQPRREP